MFRYEVINFDIRHVIIINIIIAIWTPVRLGIYVEVDVYVNLSLSEIDP